MIISNYERKENETQSFDTKCEVCGGTREALAIRRTPELVSRGVWNRILGVLEDEEWNREVKKRATLGHTGPAHSADH